MVSLHSVFPKMVYPQNSKTMGFNTQLVDFRWFGGTAIFQNLHMLYPFKIIPISKGPPFHLRHLRRQGGGLRHRIFVPSTCGLDGTTSWKSVGNKQIKLKHQPYWDMFEVTNSSFSRNKRDMKIREGAVDHMYLLNVPPKTPQITSRVIDSKESLNIIN